MSKIMLEEKDYLDLLERASMYSALEAGGVDDWEWYGFSIKDEIHYYEKEYFGLEEGTIKNFDELVKLIYEDNINLKRITKVD